MTTVLIPEYYNLKIKLASALLICETNTRIYDLKVIFTSGSTLELSRTNTKSPFTPQKFTRNTLASNNYKSRELKLMREIGFTQQSMTNIWIPNNTLIWDPKPFDVLCGVAVEFTPIN